MAEVLTDCRIWVAGHSLSGVSNNVTVNAEVAELDTTNFDSEGWTEQTAGLGSGSYEIGSFGDPADPFDSEIPALLGERAIVIIGVNDQVGSVAYFGTGLVASGTRTAPVGQIPTLTTRYSGSGGRAVLRGQLLQTAEEITDTGETTPVQLGAATADEVLHAALQIFAADDDVTVTLESSVDNTFASPTTRLTFTAADEGAEWKTAAGPVTDTWWRATYAVANAGSARIGIAAAIR